MKNTLFILSEGSSIDQETGQWSIFNHIESINLNEEPKEEEFTVNGKFNLISFWNKEEKEEFLEIKYQFVDDQGEVLMDSGDLIIEINEKTRTFKHRAKINKIPFKKKKKDYYFKLLKKESNEEYSLISRLPIKLSFN